MLYPVLTYDWSTFRKFFFGAHYLMQGICIFLLKQITIGALGSGKALCSHKVEAESTLKKITNLKQVYAKYLNDSKLQATDSYELQF